MRILGLLCLTAIIATGCQTLSPAKPKSAGDQLTGKVWLLAGYYTGTQFVPLQPGEGTTARIFFKDDGTLSGTTGINEFTGAWALQKTQSAGLTPFTMQIKGLTKVASPNPIAAKFEQDLVRQIGSARFVKKGKDSILFLGGQNEILLQFIFRKADSVF